MKNKIQTKFSSFNENDDYNDVKTNPGMLYGGANPGGDGCRQNAPMTKTDAKIPIRIVEEVLIELLKTGKIDLIGINIEQIIDKLSTTNEGTAFKDTKKKNEKSDAYGDKKEDFRNKLESYVKSQDCKTTEVGSDFEIHLLGEHIGQVIFRPDFIGVKKVGGKFVEKFKYTELGKVKAEISKIIKNAKDSK